MQSRERRYVFLEPAVRRRLFSDYWKKLGNQRQAAKSLNVPLATFRSYLYDSRGKRWVPVRQVRQSLRFLGRGDEAPKTDETIHLSVVSRESLTRGRETRKRQLEVLKKQPPFVEILDKRCIRVWDWFCKTNYRERWAVSPFMKMREVRSRKKIVIIKYAVRGQRYWLAFPRRLTLNSDLAYFLGLWVGDRAGLARFGITNQDAKIIRATKKLMREQFSQPSTLFRLDILRSTGTMVYATFGVHYLRLYREGTNHRPTYLFYVANSVLSDLFAFLTNTENLEQTLSSFSPREKEAFLAGMLDAEGHVDLINRCVKISQKAGHVQRTLLGLLAPYGAVYDGINVVIQNRDFVLAVLPHVRSSKKQALKNWLRHKLLRDDYAVVLSWMAANPNATRFQISTSFGKRLNHVVRALLQARLVRQTPMWPVRLSITKRGTHWLAKRKNVIRDRFREAKEFHITTHGKYRLNTAAIQFLAGGKSP